MRAERLVLWREQKHIPIITGGSAAGGWAVQTPLRVRLSDFYQLIFHREFVFSTRLQMYFPSAPMSDQILTTFL